ncbi:MAG: taurine dioxygenase [Acidimicrobiales bacterium]|nr:taurine dioxygenase [Acidimicrobiales bacterium]
MEATRLTPAIGAELAGIDWNQPITADLVDGLHAALIEHQVIILRDADLSLDAMVELGRHLGELAPPHHSYVTHAENPDVVVLMWEGDDKPDADEWHSDMTYRPRAPFASILKAMELPPTGGDTLWASMGAVYESLPAGLRADLDGLEVVHDMGAFRNGAYRAGGVPGIEQAMLEAGTAVHPVVAHHPVTGRPFLNVSESNTRQIIGLSAIESHRLLTYLFAHINRPDYHVRLKWQVNTIAIWDNRGTQHYAVNDYLPNRRVMHRVAVATDARS